MKQPYKKPTIIEQDQSLANAVEGVHNIVEKQYSPKETNKTGVLEKPQDAPQISQPPNDTQAR